MIKAGYLEGRTEKGRGKFSIISKNTRNVLWQSDEGGFSVQANRASCVLVRQKVFCPTRTNLPGRNRGFFSKVEKSVVPNI